MHEVVALKKLKLLDRNPRVISKAGMQKLIDSIQDDPTFIEANTIKVNVVNDVYLVYGGNQRVRALRKLKWKEVLCHVEHDLTEEQMKKRIIKDNAHYGDFDYDILANDYEVYDLLAAGLTENQLQIDSPPVEEIDEELEEEAEDKVKYCPHCNGII